MSPWGLSIPFASRAETNLRMPTTTLGLAPHSMDDASTHDYVVFGVGGECFTGTKESA